MISDRKKLHRDRGLAPASDVGQRRIATRQQQVQRDRAQRTAARRNDCRIDQRSKTNATAPISDAEPDGARHLAGRQQRIGERAEGDELALRYEDDARDREDQHQRQAKQRVDRTVGDPVLKQKQKDRRIQDRRSPSRVEPIANLLAGDIGG